MSRHPHCEYTGKDIFGAKDIKTFAKGGTPVNTTKSILQDIVSLTKDYSNELVCVHGADTSINFQYSFVVEFTSYKAEWNRANKTPFMEDSLAEVLKLATTGKDGNYFSITKLTENSAVLISPHYQKLEAISKLLEYAIPFFTFKYIGCTRFDGKEALTSYNLNHADLIKTMQNTDRKFAVKWITDRMDKALN